MTATPQAKGPVVREHQPSLDHRKPLEGKPMNAHTDTIAATAAASFPVPYSGQSSFDDMEDALSLLRIVSIVLCDGTGCSAQTAQDLNVSIAAATDRLESILIHLQNLDRDDRSDRYLNARREWIRSRGCRL